MSPNDTMAHALRCWLPRQNGLSRADLTITEIEAARLADGSAIVVMRRDNVELGRITLDGAAAAHLAGLLVAPPMQEGR